MKQKAEVIVVVVIAAKKMGKKNNNDKLVRFTETRRVEWYNWNHFWKGIAGVGKKKKIAAPEFRVWSPTTLLGQALTSLTTVDRTGNGAFW